MTRAAFPGYDRTQTQGGDELDLLRRLRRQGRVVWNRRNIVTTSARRLQRGFVYTFFVTFLTYYLLAYLLNRLSGRRWLGMAPPVRRQHEEEPGSRWPAVLAGGLVLVAASVVVAVAALDLPLPLPVQRLWARL